MRIEMIRNKFDFFSKNDFKHNRSLHLTLYFIVQNITMNFKEKYFYTHLYQTFLHIRILAMTYDKF